MLTDELEFAGLIDFNVSGTECILNYALSEALTYTMDKIFNEMDRESILSELMNENFNEKIDNSIKKYLDCVKKHYSFSNSEIKAFPKLFQMTVPFRWIIFSLFKHAILNKKDKYFDNILNWVTYQLKRKDLVNWIS